MNRFGSPVRSGRERGRPTHARSAGGLVRRWWGSAWGKARWRGWHGGRWSVGVGTSDSGAAGGRQGLRGDSQRKVRMLSVSLLCIYIYIYVRCIGSRENELSLIVHYIAWFLWYMWFLWCIFEKVPFRYVFRTSYMMEGMFPLSPQYRRVPRFGFLGGCFYFCEITSE